MTHAFKMAALLAAVGLSLASSPRADDDGETSSGTTAPYTSGAATLNHPGRLLASNCFQCHGTNGHGMESLAGDSVSSIVEEMQEMRLKPAGADIMHVHARGYTDAQINQIADYFSRQQP